MKKAPASSMLLLAVALLTASPVFSQTATGEARATALQRQDPASYVSEEPYAPGPWRIIHDSDVAWSRRVWRTVDLKDAANAAFGATAGAGNLAEILTAGALNGTYKVYSGRDDRFTTMLAPSDLQRLTAKDGAGSAPAFDPAAVTKLRIKEDWIYLAKEQKLICRIIGLAPVVSAPDGAGEEAAFWLYFPDIRTELASHAIVDATGAATGNLARLLEEHHFAGAITADRMQPALPAPQPR